MNCNFFESIFHDSSNFWIMKPQSSCFDQSRECLIRKNNKEKLVQLSFYQHFIQFQYNKYLDVENSFMELIINDTKKGIKFTKNEHQVEIFGEIDDLFQHMKKYCIQRNFQKKYKSIRCLGQGATSQVYKIRERFYEKDHAVKIFEKALLIDKNQIEQLKIELKILRKVNHKNIIRFEELFENEDRIYLIFEFLKGGELNEQVKNNPLTEEQCIKLMRNLIQSVQYLHYLGIFHRDIKPQNIILKENDDLESLCLVDFGFADFWNQQGQYTFQRCGTPGFVAPELISDKKYGLKIDVYSLGIIFYYLLTLKYPFQGANENETVKNNYYGIIDYEPLNKYSENCQQFIKAILQINPDQRPQSNQLLKHPLFNQDKETINFAAFKMRKLKHIQQHSLEDLNINKQKQQQSQTDSTQYSPTPTISLTPLSLNSARRFSRESNQISPTTPISSFYTQESRHSMFIKYKLKKI